MSQFIYETIIRDVPPEILLRFLGTHAAQARLSATTRTALRCRSSKTINNKDKDNKNKNCSQVLIIIFLKLRTTKAMLTMTTIQFNHNVGNKNDKNC